MCLSISKLKAILSGVHYGGLRGSLGRGRSRALGKALTPAQRAGLLKRLNTLATGKAQKAVKSEVARAKYKPSRAKPSRFGNKFGEGRVVSKRWTKKQADKSFKQLYGQKPAKRPRGGMAKRIREALDVIYPRRKRGKPE